MDSFGEYLRQIYNPANAQRLLNDGDYFLQQVAKGYQPEWKSDCKLLETAIRCNAGNIIWQFISQNSQPDAADTKQFAAMLQQKSNFTEDETKRILSYLYYMVGWEEKPQPSTNTKCSLLDRFKQLCSSKGMFVVVILFYVIWAVILTLMARMNNDILTGAVAIVSGVVGWQCLTRIQPRMFLFLPLIGWVLYFTIKFLLSVLAGLVCTPYKLAKLVFIHAT